MKLAKQVVIFGLSLYCIVATMNVHAVEQRCTELGVSCVCSEPFNTSVLPKVNGSYYNPGDSTTKECTAEGQTGQALVRNNTDLFGSNDPTVLSSLPAGNKVSYFTRGPAGHLGIFYGGHTLGNQYVKRAAFRYYIYHSPNFQWKDEGICTNSKMTEFGAEFRLDKSFGTPHLYNFLKWTPAQDCCLSGPGPDQSKITKQSWMGKWWRVEVVMTNRAGPGFVLKTYMKNVTDNGPQLLVVDTSAPGTQLIPSNTRTPPERMDKLHMNHYRETGCNGWLGFSHYMAAGWDTDQGQSIGPAYEIEGNGTPPPILNPPSDLRVLQ